MKCSFGISGVMPISQLFLPKSYFMYYTYMMNNGRGDRFSGMVVYLSYPYLPDTIYTTNSVIFTKQFTVGAIISRYTSMTSCKTHPPPVGKTEVFEKLSEMAKCIQKVKLGFMRRRMFFISDFYVVLNKRYVLLKRGTLCIFLHFYRHYINSQQPEWA